MADFSTPATSRMGETGAMATGCGGGAVAVVFAFTSAPAWVEVLSVTVTLIVAGGDEPSEPVAAGCNPMRLVIDPPMAATRREPSAAGARVRISGSGAS